MRKTKLILLSLMISIIAPVSASAADNIIAKIPVTCEAKDIEGSFSYHISGSDSEYATLLKDTMSLKNGDTDYFETEISYPGTYHYEITQDSCPYEYVKADDSKYEADVYVTEDESGKMEADTVVYKSGSKEKVDSCKYSNISNYKENNNENPAQTKDTGSSSKSAVKTGDQSPIEFLAAIAVFSGIILIWLFVRLKLRRKKHEEK